MESEAHNVFIKEEVDADIFLKEEFDQVSPELEIFTTLSSVREMRFQDDSGATENIASTNYKQFSAEFEKVELAFITNIEENSKAVLINKNEMLKQPVKSSETTNGADKDLLLQGLPVSLLKYHVKSGIDHLEARNKKQVLEDSQTKKRQGKSSQSKNQNKCKLYNETLFPGSPITMHKSQKKYKCDTCGKYYRTRDHILRHIKITHNLEREYECGVCKKNFGQRHNLYAHMRSRHKMKETFQCEICKKPFWEEVYLFKHMTNMHSMNKKNECNICYKVFRGTSYLSRHVDLVHKMEKKYHCNICDKKYGQKSYLVLHINCVHKSLRNQYLKKYLCDICDKIFYNKHHLVRHQNSVHQKLKKFKCSICTKSFGQSYNLTRHQKSVHNVE